MVIKTPTQWRPPTGKGYVVNIGNEFLTTNLGDFLTTNLGDFLVTNQTYVVPKSKTLWTGTGV